MITNWTKKKNGNYKGYIIFLNNEEEVKQEEEGYFSYFSRLLGFS